MPAVCTQPSWDPSTCSYSLVPSNTTRNKVTSDIVQLACNASITTHNDCCAGWQTA
jgi:hypothetical protein